jgi:hypothetical protein
MAANRGCEVDKRVHLLQLAGPRHRQEAGHRALAFVAAIAKHDLPPLDGGAQGPFGRGMPRAGLCRVGEFAPVDVGFHLEADAA